MNKFLGIGYIGKKGIDLKFGKTNGTAIGLFSLNIPRDNNKDKEKKEYDFLNVVCFKGTAEFLANNADRIKRVLVEGTVQTRNYDNKEGNKVYVTEIIASRIDVIEWNNSNQASDNSNLGDNFKSDITPIDDGDIPF